MVKKKQGRPKNNTEMVKCGIYIPKPLNESIDMYCEENMIIKSKFIEKALEQYLLSKYNQEV